MDFNIEEEQIKIVKEMAAATHIVSVYHMAGDGVRSVNIGGTSAAGVLETLVCLENLMQGMTKTLSDTLGEDNLQRGLELFRSKFNENREVISDQTIVTKREK